MRKMLIAAVVFAAFSSIAQAEVKPHKVAQISVDVPAGWTTETPDANTMVIKEPKNELAFRMMVLDEGDVKSALAKANDKIQKSFQDLKCGELKPNKLNGMDAAIQDCTATMKATPVDIGMLLVQTPAKKVLMVIALCEHSKLAARQAEMTAFLSSIKPLAK